MKSNLLRNDLSKLNDVLNDVLINCNDVVFAYLYGSILTAEEPNDIDIAIYAYPDSDLDIIAVDLQIAFHIQTGLAADVFDVRILNEIITQGDLFGLLYLRQVLENGKLLISKDADCHADFLEKYGSRFRECEGLMQEVLV